MSRKRTVFIGCYNQRGYTEKSGETTGLWASVLDPDTGTLSPPVPAAPGINPSWLTLSPDRKRLYTTEELPVPPGGRIGSYTVDPSLLPAKIFFSSSTPSGGADPCHLVAEGDFLVCANYSGGSVSLIVSEDSSSRVLPFTGTGPVPERQEGSHIHSMLATPSAASDRVGQEGVYLAVDLGADCLRILELNPRFRETGVIQMLSGSGPRHGVFSADGRFLYMVNELDSTLTTILWKSEKSEMVDRCKQES